MKHFKISLEKGTYSPGEIVNGNLSLPTNNSIKGREISFSAYCKEYTRIKVTEADGISPVYSNNHVYFFENLSPFLALAGATILEHERVEIPSEVREIPFHFTIPNSALGSYVGKNAWITYEINIKVDRSWKRDIDEKLVFFVINPDMKPTSKENVVTEYGSSDWSEREIYARLNLERNAFSPNESVKGALTVKNFGQKKIKNAKIILRGKENASGLLHITFPKGRIKEYEITNIIEEYLVDVEFNKEKTVGFELKIPEEARRSYVGKFSRYFWVLEVKLNIAFGRHLDILLTDITCY
jgi:hypothetical protein